MHSLLTPLLVKPCEHAKNLGVILDANLKFQRHKSHISKTAFIISEIYLKLDDSCHSQTLKKLFHAFISNRLDYCNTFLAELTKQVQ